jgi:CheY-like chemotaxis protein
MTSKRILVIERDDTVRSTIRDMVASHGHEVATVQWPNAAFEPLAMHAFDVVFIGRGDYLFQSTRVLSWVIRAIYPEVAIVLVTGRGQHADDAGPFDQVLLKPFSIDQIQHTIALITTPNLIAARVPALFD